MPSVDSQTSAGEDGTLAATGGVRDEALPVVRGSEIGRYVLLAPIGRGAAGQVWVAHDADLDRKVAIKVLDAVVGADAERRRRLLAEAQAMAKVRHANVVAVFDVGTHDDRVYIAMELVEGTTLRAWCQAKPRPRAAIVAVFLAAARGLAAAHAAGVIHRDFKPDNVLVEGDATPTSVKVADFGLARGTAADVEATGDGAGTPAYMSPEHHGEGIVDARSDQFSYCVALFEALWGHRPFRGQTAIEIAAATCDGAIDEQGSDAIPSRLRRVVLQGLSRAPQQRHASMDALIVALERASRRRGPAIAAAVGVAAALGVGWWRLAATPEPDECTRGAEIIAAVWGPEQRDRIALVDAGFTPAFVAARTQRIRDTLDAYAGRWAQIRDEVCALQRQAGEVDEPRLACIEDRRASFSTLVSALATQSIELDTIDAVLADLPALSACLRDGAASASPLPEDHAMREPVAELRAELRTLALQVKLGTGPADMRTAFEDLLARAQSVGYPHLIASVEAQLALLELRDGRAEQALTLLDSALVRSLSSRQGLLAAEVVCAMLMVRLWVPTARIDAERLARIAEALVAGAGGDDAIAGDVANGLATVRFESGDLRGAVAAFDQTATAWVRAFGPTDGRLVRPRMSAAVALLELGDTDAAERMLAEVMPIVDATFGEGHEIALQALSLRAGISDLRGDWRLAVQQYQDALRAAQEVGGDRRDEISALSYNLANMAVSHGLVDVARENLALSRATWPVYGDPVTEGEFIEVEASIALVAGDLEEAMRLANQAIELFGRAAGDRDHRIAAVRLTLATAQLTLRRYDDVLATLATPDWQDKHEPYNRARLAVIAATAKGDGAAVDRWLAFAEAHREENASGSIELLRLLARPHPTAQEIAEARPLRDAIAEVTFAGDPVLSVIDAWSAGRWPPRD